MSPDPATAVSAAAATLCLQRRKRTPHVVLGASAGPATTSERKPVTSAEAEPDRHEEQ
jgi:hypothetical protein